MDAPQRGRGGFRRWVPPLPSCYLFLHMGPVRVATITHLLSVPLSLSAKTPGKHFSPEEGPVSKLGVVSGVLPSELCVSALGGGKESFPAKGSR